MVEVEKDDAPLAGRFFRFRRNAQLANMSMLIMWRPGQRMSSAFLFILACARSRGAVSRCAVPAPRCKDVQHVIVSRQQGSATARPHGHFIMVEVKRNVK